MAGENQVQAQAGELGGDVLPIGQQEIAEEEFLALVVLDQAMVHQADDCLALGAGGDQLMDDPIQALGVKESADARGDGVADVIVAAGVHRQNPQSRHRLGNVRQRVGVARQSRTVTEVGIERGKVRRRDRWHAIGHRVVEADRVRVVDVMVAGADENLGPSRFEPLQVRDDAFMRYALAVLGQVARDQDDLRLCLDDFGDDLFADGRGFPQQLGVLGQVGLEGRTVAHEQARRHVVQVAQDGEAQLRKLRCHRGLHAEEHRHVHLVSVVGGGEGYQLAPDGVGTVQARRPLHRVRLGLHEGRRDVVPGQHAIAGKRLEG